MNATMKDDPFGWFGNGKVLKDEGRWVLIEWSTEAGIQWTQRELVNL